MLNRRFYGALTLLALGCSSTSDPADAVDARADQIAPLDAKADQVVPLDAKADQAVDSGKADAPLDAQDAARDAEGGSACQPVAVGRASDRGFTIRESGGLPPAPSDAGGCQPLDLSTTYDFTAKTITIRGCGSGRPAVDESYRLTGSEVTQLRAELVTFQTTCQLTCGADLPLIEISVLADSGGVRHYQSAFEAACPGHVDQSTAFGVTEFFALKTRLNAILNTCASDAGSVSDPGPPDSGPSDASVSDTGAVDGDSATCPPRERIYTSDGGDAAMDAKADAAVEAASDVAAVDVTSDVAAGGDASGD